MRRDAGAVLARPQRAQIVRQRLGQHRHDAVREIHRVAAPRRLAVERAARRRHRPRHRRSRRRCASRPGLAGSGSGSAQTASSKSRASSPSIVTSARSRRSARPLGEDRRGARPGRLGLGQRRGRELGRDVERGDRQPADRVRGVGRAEPFENAGAACRSGATAAPRRRPARRRAARPHPARATRYSVLSRRSAAAMTPPSRVRRNTPTTRFAASSGRATRRMISASTSPLSRPHEPRQRALADRRVRRRPLPVRRNRGASPSPDQSTGRTSGNPSESLPARSICAISGSAPPAANFRSGPRTTSPERSIARSRPRNAGPSAGPRPKARAISRAVSGLRIGAQKLDEVAIGRQPGAGTQDRGRYGGA